MGKILQLYQLRDRSKQVLPQNQELSQAKGSARLSTLLHDEKVAKTNTDKAQLFAESVERHFGIESERVDSNHFNEVNQFIEDNHKYFNLPKDPDDYRFDVGNEHELVEDVDA